VIFTEVTQIPGAWVIDLERHEDERGWFARTFDRAEFTARGLDPEVVESSASFNPAAGTLRGMHLQQAPHAETKLIRCTRGRVYDVMVDARRDSTGFGRWAGFELDPDGGRSVYLPEGVAHGFLTLVADSELSYQISTPYDPGAGAGFRWDDPAVAIAWPAVPTTMSDRDCELPLLTDLNDVHQETR
jgi:dTDP-4-dehydrorhamnose 3,5-epimerase